MKSSEHRLSRAVPRSPGLDAQDPRPMSSPSEEREREGDREGYGASDVPDWRGIDWRSVRRDVIVAGRWLSYVDLGEGSPIVLVHGTGGCWQNWLEKSRRSRCSAVSSLLTCPALVTPRCRSHGSPSRATQTRCSGSQSIWSSKPRRWSATRWVAWSLEAARRRPGEVGPVVMVGGTAMSILEIARRRWAALRAPKVAMAIAGEIIVRGPPFAQLAPSGSSLAPAIAPAVVLVRHRPSRLDRQRGAIGAGQWSGSPRIPAGRGRPQSLSPADEDRARVPATDRPWRAGSPCQQS